MKTNKFIITNILSFILIYFFVGIFQTQAQWSLPTNNFNLISDIESGVLNLTNWFLGFVGIFSVLIIIWGGLNYIASSGDQQKAELSKKIIYYAFIGLFISGLSYAIIKVLTTVILK